MVRNGSMTLTMAGSDEKTCITCIRLEDVFVWGGGVILRLSMLHLPAMVRNDSPALTMVGK